MNETKFGAHSTTDEILAGIDLTGKTIVVTGVSSGLGVETSRALVSRGARVIGTARDLGKADAALFDAREEAARNGGSLETLALDLDSLDNVRSFTELLTSRGEKLDIIISNAGVMAPPFGRTQDGIETQFGVNHLAPFLLINRLAPLLNSGARVVVVASSGHRAADVNLDDPNFDTTPYDPWTGYGRSKTAAVLCAVEFDRRHKADNIRAVAVHPGGIATDLGRHMSGDDFGVMMASINDARAEASLPPFQLKSIPQGAATSVWAAAVADADTIGGKYCEDCSVAAIRDVDDMLYGVRSYAVDADRARALWAKSEDMVGERF